MTVVYPLIHRKVFTDNDEAMRDRLKSYPALITRVQKYDIHRIKPFATKTYSARKISLPFHRRGSEPRRIRWATSNSTFRTPSDTLDNLKFDVPNPAGYVGQPQIRRSEPRRIRWATSNSTFRTPPDTLGNLKFDVPNPAGYVGQPQIRRSERIRTGCITYPTG